MKDGGNTGNAYAMLWQSYQNLEQAARNVRAGTAEYDQLRSTLRDMRQHLEQEFPEHFGVWLERLHVLREEMKEKLPSSREREVFWRNALQGDILSLVKNGELEQAEVRIRNAVDGNRTQS